MKDIQEIQKLYHDKKYSLAQKEVEKLIERKSNLPLLYNIYGAILAKQFKLNKAITEYKKSIKLNSNYFEPYYNLGNLFMRYKLANDALVNYEKAIKLKPDFHEAYIRLGNAYKYLNKFDETIKTFKKLVKIDPDFPGGHINLGAALQEAGHFEEAIPHLKKFGIASKARVLECLYSLKKFKEYENYQSELAKNDPANIRAATISIFVSSQTDLINLNKFCKKPFNYISIKNIKDENFNKDFTWQGLLKDVEKVDEFWEPFGRVTRQAYKTHDNIFNYQQKNIQKLKEIILNQIEIFKKTYSKNSDDFIKLWPKSFQLYGWHVRYKKLGHQTAHIHPDGWLSGVLYIKIPKERKKNEGAIKFSLHGFNYPIFNKKKKIPTKYYLPQSGDLVLFPSSLFHGTVPCESEEERHVLAFDLRPVYN